MENDFSNTASSDSWLQKMQDRVKQRAAADHDNYSAIAVRVLKK
jgi:hypothetical protein